MGRGRAKAKQTKVARDLKYRPIETDFASLERELRGSSGRDDSHDPYEDLAQQYNDAPDKNDDKYDAGH